jgi:hypothetical protein
MEEKKFPVDVMLLNVAVNNVLNDLVYYQLKEIRAGRPLSEEGETAFKELDEVICFEKLYRNDPVPDLWSVLYRTGGLSGLKGSSGQRTGSRKYHTYGSGSSGYRCSLCHPPIP